MGSDSTRWTIIQRAAAGSAEDRELFAQRYGPVIRAYLGARWGRTPLFRELEDAAQEVFLDCFKDNGALGRVDPERSTGFRAYLYGIARNVARNFERKRARAREQQPDSNLDLDRFAADEDSLAEVFDRAWASALLKEAAALQRERAEAKGPDAVRRHRLLGLRYGQGLPIREIATRWQVEAPWLHGQYRQAREEYKRALMDTVRDLHGGGPESIETECARLLEYFS